jgi:hypothetical protein
VKGQGGEEVVVNSWSFLLSEVAADKLLHRADYCPRFLGVAFESWFRWIDGIIPFCPPSSTSLECRKAQESSSRRRNNGLVVIEAATDEAEVEEGEPMVADVVDMEVEKARETGQGEATGLNSIWGDIEIILSWATLGHRFKKIRS